ncbi:MAG: SAF domain-containing protein [Lachnospiraceae bacterium]|nr:SAF domain-containing protein [Lachnospiraceae bacterium]
MRKIKISRTNRQYLAIIVVSLIICGSTAFLSYRYYTQQMQNLYEGKINALQNQVTSATHYVYVSGADGINAGTLITDDLVYQEERQFDLPDEQFITEEDLGSLAAVDIPAGQPILKTMCTENLEFGLREQEFAMFTLSNNLETNDYVDVRIMFANGENYSVLTKKCIHKIDLTQNDIFLWLNEDEISLISAAIVDTYMHSGTSIYTTKYINYGQSALQVTYQPNQEVMTAMANNPNIVSEATEALDLEARQLLENRIAIYDAEGQNTISTDKVYDTPAYTQDMSEEAYLPEEETGSDVMDETGQPEDEAMTEGDVYSDPDETAE